MGNPMYRQIAEDLRAQIESGGLKPGQQLRTELELRERYNASRSTHQKGGEGNGEAACASLEPVSVRALRPPLLADRSAHEPSALAGTCSADGEVRSRPAVSREPGKPWRMT
jgi:DNA-binding transcriptional MocR family regulator